MKIKVSSATVTSKFMNGFSVDFTLLGDTTTHSGRMYEGHGEDRGNYGLTVYLTKEMKKYTDEPHSHVTDEIGKQILKLIGE